jgi:hypothetical protein
MTRKLLRFVHRLADDPRLNLLAGLVLLVTGFLESVALLFEGALRIPIGAHHGIAVFSFLQVMKALPDTLRALKFVEDGEEVLTSDAAAGAAHPKHAA